MKKIKILILILIGLLIMACEKEPITPNPIEEPIDTVDIIENYIEIKGGNYYHNPKYIIYIEKIVYGPLYNEIDTISYIEDDMDYSWGLLINGIWYEIIPVEYEKILTIDTINNNEIYRYEIDYLNNDTMWLEYNIKYEYLDNQYNYETSMYSKLIYNNISIYEIIGNYSLGYNELNYNLTKIQSIRFYN